MLRKIPGPPYKIEVICKGPDRLKLSWQPPKENPEAVETYILWKKSDGMEWEKLGETRKTKMLITGLKPGLKYQFRIIATNDLVKSMDEVKISSTEGIEYSRLLVGMSGAFVGAFAGIPGLLALNKFVGNSKKLMEKTTMNPV